MTKYAILGTQHLVELGSLPAGAGYRNPESGVRRYVGGRTPTGRVQCGQVAHDPAMLVEPFDVEEAEALLNAADEAWQRAYATEGKAADQIVHLDAAKTAAQAGYEAEASGEHWLAYLAAVERRQAAETPFMRACLGRMEAYRNRLVARRALQVARQQAQQRQAKP